MQGSEEAAVLVRDRVSLVSTLSVVTASVVAWIAVYFLRPLTVPGAGDSNMGIMMFATLSPGSIFFFELVWVVGMVAMMFPAMLPVLLYYNKLVAAEESAWRAANPIRTSLFLGGYLLTYSGLGVLVFLAVFIGVNSALLFPVLWTNAGFGPGIVLAVAGLYQLSPTKSKSLSRCVSPATFLMARLRGGPAGALLMGIDHGRYCAQCCWAYMLVMAAVGAMSLSFMAIIAGVVALEKGIFRGAAWFTRTVAVILILLGVATTFLPRLLTFI